MLCSHDIHTNHFEKHTFLSDFLLVIREKPQEGNLCSNFGGYLRSMAVETRSLMFGVLTSNIFLVIVVPKKDFVHSLTSLKRNPKRVTWTLLSPNNKIKALRGVSYFKNM